jgi:hypothetical protein
MKSLEDFEQCAQRLKALADPERLRIMSCLLAGGKNVGDLATELQDEIVRVSHHLGVLRNAGLVNAEKQGRFVFYSLAPEVCCEQTPVGEPQVLNLGCCSLDISARAQQRCAWRLSRARSTAGLTFGLNSVEP